MGEDPIFAGLLVSYVLVWLRGEWCLRELANLDVGARALVCGDEEVGEERFDLWAC